MYACNDCAKVHKTEESAIDCSIKDKEAKLFAETHEIFKAVQKEFAKLCKHTDKLHHTERGLVSIPGNGGSGDYYKVTSTTVCLCCGTTWHQ
jgi:hypothetical protein